MLGTHLQKLSKKLVYNKFFQAKKKMKRRERENMKISKMVKGETQDVVLTETV